MSNLSVAKKVTAGTKAPQNLQLIIKIEGKSAEDLFLAGPIDIRDHFLNAGMKLDPKDVSSIKFTEPDVVQTMRKVKKPAHPENF